MADANRNLANRILIGLVIGALAGVLTLGLGHFYQPALTFMQKVSTSVFDPLGQVFLRMLFFVVIPLVFSSLASGVTQIGQLDKLGPLAGRTFTLFFANMAIAVALGLVMMAIVNPGNHLDATAKDALMAQYGGDAIKHVATSGGQPSFSFAMLVDMFMPRNLLGAVTGQSRGSLGEVLPLILFAILLGAVGTQLPADKRQKLQDSLDLVTELMTGIVHFALRLAPYAVAAMLYSVVVKIGVDIILALGVFVLGCVGVMVLHLFGTMSIWLKMFTKRSPRVFFRQIKTVLVTAFSTSSSNATMPTSIDCARETLKVSPSTTGFVIPLGATMNMSGTALYEGCVVLFVAQVFGVDLTMAQQLTLLVLSVLSAVAVAGIPGGSLPLIAGLLASFGIPPEGIGIVLGADRILDMARTTVNVGCDLVTAVIVDEKMQLIDAGKPTAES
ncbi:MAG: dicarboxylate/amino acid:cation symporter [Opitutaceae bacterium]|nr:dicarboxylate/amino acid:cation symporter [Opitutaceae bacterium]